MNTQPEALRLADELDWRHQEIADCPERYAADELRRLHAANIDCMDYFNALKEERDQLLEALRKVRSSLLEIGLHPKSFWNVEEDLSMIDAVIAKAEE